MTFNILVDIFEDRSIHTYITNLNTET